MTPIASCRIQHGVRLHEALNKVGVVNQLITIPGGGHGNFTPEQRTMIYTTIQQFLKKNGCDGC